MSAVPITAGAKLGPYEVVSQIGAGGMGEVYRARDTKLKRDVAVKVLPQEFSPNVDHVTRFNREAELLASLSHPNLAAVYSLGEYEGQPFIVMELLEGQTLKASMETERLTTSKVLELAIQMAGALDAAHSRGVVHRDIKPANIHVTESCQSKILDFGIGKLLEKDRRLRYQGAADLRSDLQRLKREFESGSQMPQRSTEKKSIVVLPFADISASRDNEYFADGLTDEIITDLSQIQTLRVISRNSSMQLKGAGRDLRTIAQELKVQYALEGTVRKAGDNLRVTAQLIDATTDEHLWADKYSGTLEDIFDIQERISRQIVGALKMKLSPREDRRLAELQLTNIRAYECYQRAQHEIYTFTEEGLDRALRLIDDAAAIVGDNELLCATRGMVYWQFVNAAIRSDEVYLEKTEECARTAFRLNAESAAGFLLLGVVSLTRGRQVEAIKNLKRVLTIEPGNTHALGELSRIYLVAGQEFGARDSFDRLMAVDPFSTSNQYEAFVLEFTFGRPENAQQLADQVLQRAPGYAILRFVRALWPVYAGRLDEARDILAEAPVEVLPTIAGQCCVFLRHALHGRRDAALAGFSEPLKAGAKRVEWWSWYVAECYAFAGESDEALDWLENAVRLGFINYPFLYERDMVLKKLHGHPRFEALMQKVKHAWEHFEA